MSRAVIAGYNVPVFDDAWKEQQARWSYLRAMTQSYPRFGLGRPETTETLREDYAAGKITLEALHDRLDEVLR